MAKLICDHCGRKFIKQSTFDSHLCEGKKRYIVQYTRIGMCAIDNWIKFKKIKNIRIKKSIPPIESFIKSSEFMFFINFTIYVNDTQPLYPEEFVEFVYTNCATSFDWEKNETLQKWTIHVLKKEDMREAIKRSIESVHQWSVETGKDWKTFFSEVSPSRAVLWIELGKLSPWFIYGCSTSRSLFDRLTDDEFNHIFPFIDPHIWGVLKLKHKSDYDEISTLLHGHGI